MILRDFVEFCDHNSIYYGNNMNNVKFDKRKHNN